jgi:hypothetical protein
LTKVRIAVPIALPVLCHIPYFCLCLHEIPKCLWVIRGRYYLRFFLFHGSECNTMSSWKTIVLHGSIGLRKTIISSFTHSLFVYGPFSAYYNPWIIIILLLYIINLWFIRGPEVSEISLFVLRLGRLVYKILILKHVV